MTLQKTLTALYKNIICVLAMYVYSMSLAYAGYIEPTDWCDPSYCCPPKETPLGPH
jgi:hypothetical protein